MSDDVRKPRLITFEDIAEQVRELRRRGIDGVALYDHILRIGPVDLDMLEVCIHRDNEAA